MGAVPMRWDGRAVPLSEARLLGPRDIVDRAAHEPILGGVTWPESWHLDRSGAFQCGHRGSTLESARTWADDPRSLLRTRREGLSSPEGCPPDWLIIDSRPRAMWGGEPIGEADARAYLLIRSALAAVGVRLLDLMIFDDDRNWWSIGQLLSGHGCQHPLDSWPEP